MNKTFIVCLVAMLAIQFVLCEENKPVKPQDSKNFDQGRDKREADPHRGGGYGGNYGGGHYGGGHYGGGHYGGGHHGGGHHHGGGYGYHG